MAFLLRRASPVIAALVGYLVLTAGARAATTFANPVLPGDYPDPTVVRTRGAFYASSTSASWAPIFPIFRSADLVRWRQVGAVFPRRPQWAGGNFWAPELVRWEQEVDGTPFERLLASSRTSVALAAADGGTRVELRIDQQLRGVGRLGGFMVKRAARKQLDDALTELDRLHGGGGV